MSSYGEAVGTDKYRVLIEFFERMIEKRTWEVDADTEYI